MDYTVGSLADLISGSNTPNKPQVIKKKIKRKSVPLDQTPQDAGPTISKKKSKTVKSEDVLVSESPNASLKSEKKKKKRKLDDTDMDLVDSGAEEDVGIPEKKPKLTQNDQNAERRVKKKLKEEKKVENPEELARTIFVGNVPIKTNKKKVRRHFKKYGPIESLRFRGIPVADPKTSKKVAAIKKEFHPDRSNVYCYIRFINKEDALKAEEANGSLYEDHHIRVHCCGNKEKPDESKAIFVGNLSFDAEEDELWKVFESCGPIAHVRIIRDSYTGMGKGFGYVNFRNSDAVQMALEMENVKLKDRELRISLSNLSTAKKNKNKNKNKVITKAGKPKPRKPFGRKRDSNPGDSADGDHRPERPNWGNHNKGFQGAKFTDNKKKFKMNKGVLEKNRKIKKIAPLAK
ncbi:unnamed protein product [Phaedon cochleariae]|uniref:RRM domain-containing protein n=1 Tax=Phaedon cochleariae TaxID=80249 RepID=A0A9P0GNS5_PHACE|nr:unnamed protein product [Phaedon cochleariae]